MDRKILEDSDAVTSLQQQARALGDPTRHEIFRFIADAARPVDVAELTAAFGLNHNAVRQHLAKLVEGELVVGSHAPPAGRGRPRLTYTIHPMADSRWGVTGPYERLSILLTEMVRTGSSADQIGIEAGRRARGSERADDGVHRVVAAMASHGFAPEVRGRPGHRVDVVLTACPFESAALTDPDTICALHVGIARGAAEGSGVAVDDLVRRDPRRAGCVLRLRHLDEPDATADRSTPAR
jgi:predicted ArsR family transcriptional regulator